jgi:hypothetical protein
MWRTKLNIPATAAGRTVELRAKAGKETKQGDVLLWVGTRTEKTSGEMKGQIQGARDSNLFKNILNFLKGRRPATRDELVMHCMNRGMTRADANIVLENVTMDRGKSYVAESFNEELKKFDNARREQVQKTGESPNTKASIVTN